MTIDPTTIDLTSLSADQIDKLLQEYTDALEEVSKNMTIHDVIVNRVSTEWETIEQNMRSKFHSETKNEKEEFMLKESIRIVLRKAIGEDLTKEFMKILSSCVRQRSFMGSQGFYQKTKSQTVRDVAKLAFFVYRHNQAIADKKTIREAKKLLEGTNNILQTAISDFRSLNLLSI